MMGVVRAAVFIFFLSAVAFGGEIQGRVSNAQGAAVAGAKVTVTNQHEGGRWEAVTTADGTYAIADLESGTYTLTVSLPSGQETLRKEVALAQGSRPVRADFQIPATPAASSTPAAEERNPNIFVYRIDLNDLRNRLSTARGPDPQYLPEFKPEMNYLGAEFGTPLQSFDTLRPRPLQRRWRATLAGAHQNSALNARNFFNVGPLRSSRTTTYELIGEGPLSESTSLLLNFGQNFISGFVNGNVQAPLEDERSPRSSDPQINAILRNLLRAFPSEVPNLQHVSLRQLNSNAERKVKGTNALARLDGKFGDATSGAVRYFINEYDETPFQIILGQNPQTNLRFQGLYTNLTRTVSPNTVGRFGFQYDRVRATLDLTQQYADLFAPLGLPTVPDVVFRGGSLGLSASLGLGSGKQFPRFRVQNRFQFYADGTKIAGRHSLTAGWGTARVQVNDLQSDNTRGTLSFNNEIGPNNEAISEVANFLAGKPSQLALTIGNLYRGFRNWDHFLYFGDQVRLFPTFSLNFGIRYELMTAPTEVNRLTDVNFPTDKNNLAPRFGFAWNPARGKTTLRGAYGISYGTIMPVTYGMTRFNPPAVQVLQVNAPDLRDLVALLSTANQPPVPGARSSLFRLSPDLEFPYSHQYSFGIERELPGAAQLRLAYIGMRSFHLLALGVYNRPVDVPGIVATTANINQRRPDQRYFEVNLIESTSLAYYDAVQLSLTKRLSRGLAFRATYTFGKNIDLNGDFTNSAAGVEVPPEIGTTTCEHCDRVSDQKGPSIFDTPHVLVINYTYNLPFPANRNGWASSLFRGWQVSGTTNYQSGIAYHIHTGSDAPGFGNVDGTTQDRPNILNPALLGKSFDNPDTAPSLLGAGTCTAPPPFLRCRYFDTNIPVAGRGNLGQNTFRKHGTHNWNLALARTFRLPGDRERSLQFRAEFFNFFNQPQFDKPQVLLASETFGKITNTVNKGRQIQLSLRLGL